MVSPQFRDSTLLNPTRRLLTSVCSDQDAVALYVAVDVLLLVDVRQGPCHLLQDFPGVEQARSGRNALEKDKRNSTYRPDPVSTARTESAPT